MAWADGRTHRFSLRMLGVCAALTVACLAGDAVSSAAWGRALSTGVIVLAVSAGAISAWVWAPGISFGDVLLVMFAVLVPAWAGPATAAATILLAFIAAGGIVMVRCRRSDAERCETIAFAPALLAGWIVGLTAL